MKLFSNIDRMVVFIAMAIVLLLRLLGDVVFFSIGISNSVLFQYWQITSSILFLASLILYFFSNSSDNGIKDGNDTNIVFLQEYTGLLYVFIFLAALILFIPEQVTSQRSIEKLLSFISAEITMSIAIIATIYSLWFLFKWTLIRRHKKTLLYLKIIGITLTYFFIFEIIANISQSISTKQIFNYWILFFLCCIVFALLKRNNWIASLPRIKKFKLMLVSVALIVISILLSIAGLGEEERFHQYLTSNITGGYYLSSSVMLFISVFAFRLLLAVLASLPTSSIVERKTSELSTLTYLNRFITDSASKDLSYLLETVTQLAIHASGGSAVWTEVYDSDVGEVRIGASININPILLNELHSKINLRSAFYQINEPLLIESIPETSELAAINQFLPNANAMIAVPLFQGSSRFGTLVVVDSEEFGFEYDDIKVLAAFGDNVNLALENSRLLNDSIEKERVLSELLIAKRIQNKLLPNKLPKLDNYLIQALSLPSEEVGGDYYDVSTLANGNICILIGDVSGKGMSAAFYMAQLKGVVQSHSQTATSPAELLKQINKTLFGLMDKQSFITMLCLMIDCKNDTISYARAGHLPLILYNNQEIKLLQPKGIGIGLAPSNIFDKFIEEDSVILQEGDACLMITDGITELRNNNGEELGYAPLYELLIKQKNSDDNQFAKQITELISHYLDENVPHDDITYVFLKKQN